jgi:capsular exopolysaccharide synthesis family protein
MELQDYVRIFRDRWLTICATTLVAVVIAVLVTASATPMYRSSSRLFITTPQTGSSDAYQGGLFSQQRVKSYANLVTGEEISRRVVEKLNLDETPRTFTSRISAAVEPDTVVLNISVTDPSPTQARRLTQATAQEFVTYVSELETTPGNANPPVKASIVDRATTPAGAYSPRPVRNVLLAVIIGLFAGCGFAVLRDRFDNRVRSEDDLSDATKGAPVLGNIHYDKKALQTPLIRDLGSHDPRVEAFRVLRTNLQFINVDVMHKVYVVTSAVPGEGKSSTTCNMAESLASSGDRVLLIEGDLRRPRATEYLGLENAVGVTTVLVGRVRFEAALQRAGDGFDFMASGRVPPNPAELLQSTAMLAVLREARALYDVVLIDAPPLLPVTDAAVLTAESDGALLVVRHNSTTRDQVANALARLESVGARLLGSIVTMSPRSKRASSGYGYGYVYGYEPDGGGGHDSDLERVARR